MNKINTLLFFFQILFLHQSFGLDKFKTSSLLLENSKNFTYLESCCITNFNAIERMVVIIHGENRNSDDYFNTLYNATNSANKVSQTLIIAPSFKISSEISNSNEVYWSSSGWKEGDFSKDSLKISSYAIIDRIIQEKVLSQAYPNLKEIVVAGHSAGSQFTQRYAFSSNYVDVITEQFPIIKFKFIVANPSSYIYLNESRPQWAGEFYLGGKYPEKGGLYFSTPNSNSTSPFLNPYPFNDNQELAIFQNLKEGINSSSNVDCTCGSEYVCDYNIYKYGTFLTSSDLNHYACYNQENQICNNSNYLNLESAINRYMTRKVFYVLGQFDNSVNPIDPTDNDSLDTTCMANFQGADRLSRGLYYMDYITSLSATHNHQLLIVPDVGHSSSGMYSSYKTQRAIFNLTGGLAKQEYLAPKFYLSMKGSNNQTVISAYTSSSNSYYAKLESISTSSSETQKWIITDLENSYYRLSQSKSLRYLSSTTTSSTDFKANTGLYSDNNSLEWNFIPVPKEPNTYYIQYKINSRFLTAKKSNSTVVTRTYAGTDDQKWILIPTK